MSITALLDVLSQDSLALAPMDLGYLLCKVYFAPKKTEFFVLAVQDSGVSDLSR